MTLGRVHRADFSGPEQTECHHLSALAADAPAPAVPRRRRGPSILQRLGAKVVALRAVQDVSTLFDRRVGQLV